MRLRMAWALPWLLAAALPVLLTQGSAAQEDNLLINGGFEHGAEGWLAIAGELTVDSTFVHSGSSAGAFVADDTFSRHELSSCLSIAPSADYQFAGYVARREADLASKLHMDISWYGRSDCFGEEVHGGADEASVELAAPGTWYALEADAQSPPGSQGVRLRIVIEPSGAAVHLDDFAVYGPPAPIETPTPEPSGSPTRTPVPDATPVLTATPVPTATPVLAEGTLLNGDFEEADSEGRPSYWQKYGGGLARTNTIRFEGRFAAAFTSQTGSTKWAYQVVKVQGGKAYALSGYALKDDPAVAAAFFRVSWYASPDGSRRAIDSADSTTYLTDDLPEFRFLTTGAVVAPAEAVSAKVRVMLDPTGDTAGTLYFDSLTFEETVLPEPEPTPSPSATPRPAVDGPASTARPTAAATSLSTATATPRQFVVSTPAETATAPPPSQTAVRVGHAATRATAALSATRTPVARATAVVAFGDPHTPALVYRERKPDVSATSPTATSAGSGLSVQFVALAAGAPVLAAMGATMYYRRWRRARLR
jgi:hypothetical protein